MQTYVRDSQKHNNVFIVLSSLSNVLRERRTKKGSLSAFGFVHKIKRGTATHTDLLFRKENSFFQSITIFKSFMVTCRRRRRYLS